MFFPLRFELKAASYALHEPFATSGAVIVAEIRHPACPRRAGPTLQA
jgi:hypothetical protein